MLEKYFKGIAEVVAVPFIKICIFLKIKPNVLSFLGLISYYKNDVKILFFYLFFISIFLEICHILIPQRSFEFKDLIGNFLGVFIIFIIFYLYYFIKRNR